jgi:hypothetical protein
LVYDCWLLFAERNIYVYASKLTRLLTFVKFSQFCKADWCHQVLLWLTEISLIQLKLHSLKAFEGRQSSWVRYENRPPRPSKNPHRHQDSITYHEVKPPATALNPSPA